MNYKAWIAALLFLPWTALAQIETPGSGTPGGGSLPPGSTGSSTNASGQVAFTNLAWGRTLWVDSVFGNNNTAIRGDATKPWASVAHAASNAVAGDTVRVRPGLYTETVSVDLAHGVSLCSDNGDPMTTTIQKFGDAINEPTVSLASTSSIVGLKIRGWAGATGIIFPLKTFYRGAVRGATNFLVANCIIEGDTDCIQVTGQARCTGRIVSTELKSEWDVGVIAGPHRIIWENCSLTANPHGSTNDRTAVFLDATVLKTSGGATNIFMACTLVATNGGDGIVQGGSHVIADAGANAETNVTFLRNSFYNAAGTNSASAAANTAAFAAIGTTENGNSNNVIRLENCNRQTIYASETNYAVQRNDGLVMVTNGPARVYMLPNIAPHGRPDFDGLELWFHDYNGTASGTNIWLVTQLGQKFINGPSQTNLLTTDYGYSGVRVRGTNWIPIGSFP